MATMYLKAVNNRTEEEMHYYQVLIKGVWCFGMHDFVQRKLNLQSNEKNRMVWTLPGKSWHMSTTMQLWNHLKVKHIAESKFTNLQ